MPKGQSPIGTRRRPLPEGRAPVPQIRELGKNDKYRILLVDDHPIVREGLAELINRTSDLQVSGQAGNAHDGLELVQKLKPDLAVVDLYLQFTNGIELIKTIRTNHPQLPLLVLSMHDEVLYAERALRAGARGYIMKQEASEKILAAIHSVLKGEIYLSDRMKNNVLQHLVHGRTQNDGPAIDRLSDRELEVFQLIGNGFGTRQIAEQLHLSIKTIESYRESLKQKMRLKSGSELVQRAIQWSRGGDALI